MANTRRTCFKAAASQQVVKKADNVFKRLGGGPAVKAAVNIFYDKMLADDRVNYFFDGIDMKKQRAHQTIFLTFALGGTDKYDGSNMTVAHQRLVNALGMRMEHFDIVLHHLGASLQDLNVPEADIAETAAIVETLRPAFQEAVDNASA